MLFSVQFLGARTISSPASFIISATVLLAHKIILVGIKSALYMCDFIRFISSLFVFTILIKFIIMNCKNKSKCLKHQFKKSVLRAYFTRLNFVVQINVLIIKVNIKFNTIFLNILPCNFYCVWFY